LLVVTSATDHGYLDVERRRGTPVVFLDRPAEDIVADAVVIDNATGVGLAVEYLLGRRHRRIAIVGDLARLSTQRERLAAFGAAMTAAGVGTWQRFVRADVHDVAAAERAVRELMSAPTRPSAVFTTNNRITTGALRALRDHAQPPALIGFDDFDLADLLGVSVVAHSPELMGQLGAARVIARLQGDESPPIRELLPVTLIVRESSERSSRTRAARRRT